MGTFQIDRVDKGFNAWSPPDKPNLVYHYYIIHVAGEDGRGEVGLRRLASEPPPAVNEVLEGYEIVNKPGKRPELKQERRAGTPSSAMQPKPSDFRSPEQIMMGEAIGKANHQTEVKVSLLAHLNPEDREREAKKLAAVTWSDFSLVCNAMYQLMKDAP